MSLYDQLAFSTKLDFYLSSPLTTDQSNGTQSFSISATLDGQPIIYGHSSSFIVTDSTNITFTSNPGIFVSGKTLEFVAYLDKPSDEYALFLDSDNGNGIFIGPTYIKLKLYFNIDGTTVPISSEIPIYQWSKKFYFVLSFSDYQASLKVNDFTTFVQYSGTPISTITNCVITAPTSAHFLIDGIGIYSNTKEDKQQSLNDPGTGHKLYSSMKYAGLTTFFDGYTASFTSRISSLDFVFSELNSTINYIFQIPTSMFAYEALIVKCSDSSLSISYTLDQLTPSSFTDKAYIDMSIANLAPNDYIAFNVVYDRSASPFYIDIIGINNGDIVFNTPANLALTGQAIYTGFQEESLVNCTDGVLLNQGWYSGTWDTGITFPNVPQSIEIVFKPNDISTKTYVYSSSDGTVSYGPSSSITGFTAYLNGVNVANLNSIKPNQWNHLVLTKSSTSDTGFYLNYSSSDHSPQYISYMFLTAYQAILTSDQVADLYNITAGIDIISISESPIPLIEGTFSNGLPYNLYSYSWAIVSGGGTR